MKTLTTSNCCWFEIERAYMSQTTLVCVENSTVGTHRSNQRVFKHGSNIIGKVVNDVQNVIPSKHYIIDSSSETEEDGAEGADQVQRKTAEKLVRAKSSFSSGAGGDSKHEAPNFRTAGSQRERGVHFADDIQVCGSKDNIESPGSLSPPPPASAPSIIHPFFTWNVVSYSTSRVSYSQSHVKVYPLLNQVDKTMARKRQRIHRYLYWRGFECTLQELERRHPYLTSTRSNDVSNHISEMKKDRLDGTRGRPGGAQSKRFYTILEEDHDMDAIRPSLEWQNMVNNNLRPLFDVFKAVAQTFVPADMEVVHRYWKKLWGSMGQILRCIEIHYKLSHESAEYFFNSKMISSIAFGDVLGNTEEVVLNCSDCEEGTRYMPSNDSESPT